MDYMCNKANIFLLVSSLFVLFSCSKHSEPDIVDWYPVIITINATDAGGNSIISPEMPGMSLKFKGESYSVKSSFEFESVQTKTYLARFFGLVAVQENDGYQLWFGEIDGAFDMDEDIVLSWPDGSKDTIHYHCSDHKGGKNPSCKRSWKLNGKKCEGPVFSFTGKSLRL